MSRPTNNPYVGPRTFLKEEGDLFFGRDREARDLSALIATEKLVLFYAQSGAGKSSIMNTRLIPELEEEFYEVLPTGRVSGELPKGIEVRNIYIYNLIRSLIRREIDPESIADLTLSQFLGRLNEDEDGYFYDAKLEAPIRGNPEIKSWRRALIIDQFEEIFSTSIDAWDKREDFFRQLGQAMEADPYLWVILTMRDDYIAALDPFAYHLPGGLRVRYYMQRLGQAAAVKAVKSPAEKFRRPYAEGVAEKLVENLASIHVKKTGEDEAVAVKGQFVEPVQLQVICQSLWRNLSAGSQITQEDVDKLGDVNQALEKYYDERVLDVANDKNVPQRLIREWFEKELITRTKTRNMVLRNTNNDTGLRDDVIQSLLGDLVRAELRAGQIWYELSHDRLIEPIIKSNSKWFEENLSLFQRQVVLWTQQDRSDSLLLKGRELLDAEREAESLHLTPDEEDFLKESKLLRKSERRDQWQRRIIFAALVVSVLLLVASVFSYLSAVQARDKAEVAQASAEQARAVAERERANAVQAKAAAVTAKEEAEIQARIALAGSLSAQAESVKANNHALALLLGVEAYQGEDNLLTRTTLFQLLQFTPYTRLFGYKGSVTSVAVSPNGKVIASSGCREFDNNQCAHGEIILSDALKHQPIGSISGDFGNMNSVAFNEDGNILAAGGCVPVDKNNKGCTDSKGQITLWDITDPASPTPLSDIRSDKHVGAIKSIAFSPNGQILASGSFDERINLWNVSDPKSPEILTAPLLGHTSFVNGLAFSPHGNTLVSAGDDRTILLWNVSYTPGRWPPNLFPIGDPIEAHSAPVNSIAFSPDGKKFASASSDNTVLLWEWIEGSLQNPITPSSLENPITLEGHTGYVTSLAFNTNGSTLASAGFDNHVILWNTSTAEQIGPLLSAHTRPINTIVFGTAETQAVLFSGSNDRTVIAWDLSTRRPLSQPEKESPEEAGQTAQSGDLKATVDGQNINLQDGSGSTKTLPGHTGAINSLSFSLGQINGRMLLASASDDQTVILWDASDSSAGDVFLKLEGFESPVTSASFRDDGTLITVEENGHITQWIIDPAAWKSLACEAANRNLTRPDADPQTDTEWEKFMQDETYRKTCENLP